MALVISELAGGRDIPMAGGQKARVVQIVGDAAYVTAIGGSPITAAQLGMATIAEISGAVSAGIVMAYEPVSAIAGGIKLYQCGAAANPMAEMGTGVVGPCTFRVLVIGT